VSIDIVPFQDEYIDDAGALLRSGSSVTGYACRICRRASRMRPWQPQLWRPRGGRPAWRSTNLLTARFWPRQGFRPVAYRLVRRVDQRIAWANPSALRSSP
jgi:hypothetical protein